MLSIAITEDQSEVAEEIKEYIKKYAEEKALLMDAVWYPDGEAVVHAVKDEGVRFDIMLFDIEMSGINGMEAAKLIRSIDQRVVLAFITNMAQFAIRGYEVDALDFILKPIEYESFSMHFDRMVERVRERSDADVYVTIHTTEGMERFRISEIRYLETQNRFLYYHTGNGTYAVRGSLREAQKDLTHGRFAKCNQCYLVNLAFVEGVNGDYVKVDGEKLEISRRNKKPFMDELTRYIGGNI